MTGSVRLRKWWGWCLGASESTAFGGAETGRDLQKRIVRWVPQVKSCLPYFNILPVFP